MPEMVCEDVPEQQCVTKYDKKCHTEYDEKCWTEVDKYVIVINILVYNLPKFGRLSCSISFTSFLLEIFYVSKL